MEQQFFCDGIGRISVIGGVVRLDLFTYSPTETDANGQPRPVLSHRIMMGMDGFVRSSEKVVEAVQAITRTRPQNETPQPQQVAQPQQPSPQQHVAQQPPQWPPKIAQPAQPAPAPPPPAPAAAAPKPVEAPPSSKPPFP